MSTAKIEKSEAEIKIIEMGKRKKLGGYEVGGESSFALEKCAALKHLEKHEKEQKGAIIKNLL
jgi:hypothetical protein